jgi:hypothetical protein
MSPLTLEEANPTNVDSGIPERVRLAFAATPFLSLSGLSVATGWDVKTLRRHCVDGTLIGRTKGFGRVRRHRVFTLADFDGFWERLKCQSSSAATAPAGGTTSNLAVIDFPARPRSRKPVPDVKRKRSRMRSGPKPGRLLLLQSRRAESR